MPVASQILDCQRHMSWSFLFKDRVFSRNNAAPSTLRFGQTPRTSCPEIKSERFDGYQYNLTSHPMTKRRKQSMSPREKTVHNQQSISQNTALFLVIMTAYVMFEKKQTEKTAE
jgi:hypothetical protein